MKFKVGDRVMAVNVRNGTNFNKGDTGVVTKIWEDGTPENTVFMRVDFDNGKSTDTGYYEWRFAHHGKGISLDMVIAREIEKLRG